MTPYRIAIARYVDHRFEAIEKKYAELLQGADDKNGYMRATLSGLTLASQKLMGGDIRALEDLIREHTATDRLMANALADNRKIFIGNQPVTFKRLVQHGIELREMNRALKLARRVERLMLPPAPVIRLRPEKDLTAG